jgi:hypothetical protein
MVRGVVDCVLAALGEHRLSHFAPGDVEGLLADTGWQARQRETTSPGRADGAYLLTVAASPSADA